MGGLGGWRSSGCVVDDVSVAELPIIGLSSGMAKLRCEPYFKHI